MNENLKYSFIPWLRRGVSNNINEEDTLGESESESTPRSSFDVAIHIDAQKINQNELKKVKTIKKRIQLVGPGDVIGIKSHQIIKTVPGNNTTNMAPNYLSHIEFYDEDFPWRYTPAKAVGEKLRPWLTLIVMTEDEFEELKEASQFSPLPMINIKAPKSVFPQVTETWAWAHAHYTGEMKYNTNDGKDKFKDILNHNPNIACSRLICPRKLAAKTSYHAFLVPAFEQGRLAGIGASSDDINKIPVQQASWSNDDQEIKKYPYYHRFYFATGLKGDFEYLVRLLEPREDLDPKIGKRDMDIQNAGEAYNFKFDIAIDADDPLAKGTLPLEGALQLPNSADLEIESESLSDFTKNIKKLLNSQLLEEKNTTDDYDDPLVLPPLYGAFHCQKFQLEDDGTAKTDWFHEMNLDLRNRAIAGMGVEVVKKNQEEYMARCYDQLEEVLSENARRKKDYYLHTIQEGFFDKHLDKIIAGNYLRDLSPLKDRLDLPTIGNFNQLIRKSSTPNGVFSPVMTKFSRSSGTFAKRITKTNTNFSFNNFIHNSYSAEIQAPVLKDISPISVEDVSTIYGNDANRIREIKGLIGENREELNQNDIKPPLLEKRAGSGKGSIASAIKEQLSPENTLKKKLKTRYTPKNEKTEQQSKIMAYPEINDAMYKPLLKKGAEYLLPNINLIPPNTVAMFKTNRDFIDAYMVGLNQEMGSELLWREFPTDQRGSYFRKFWENSHSVEDQPKDDIEPIDQWKLSTKLGSHLHNPRSNEGEQMVLGIRGELLNRFPNAMIFLAKEKEQVRGSRTPNMSKDCIRKPLFHAKVDPDISFLGFNLTVEEAQNYFVIIGEEVPGEPRFGLDVGADIINSEKPLSSWNYLSWKHIKKDGHPVIDHQHIIIFQEDPKPEVDNRSNPEWGKSSAHIAAILHQKPFMVAIHATDLLPISKNQQ